MKRTRIVAFLLALSCLFALSACSSDAEETTQTTTEPNDIITEPTAEVGEHGEMIFESANAKCLFENESCSFTLQKAEIDSLSDYCWDVTLVNRSSTTQIFTVNNVYVNDFAFDPIWAVKVPAGSTIDESIIWTSPEMDARGITQITRVDLDLRVYAEDGSKEFAGVSLTDYPSGKSAYIPKTRNPKTTDVVEIDNADYTVIITGYDPEHRWGCALELYLYNKTDKTVVFTAENVLLSGCDSDPQWRLTLPAGKQAISQMIWFEDQLEEAGELTGISFDLLIKDENGTALVTDSCIYIP